MKNIMSVLKSRRCRLVPYKIEHIEAILKMYAEPNSNKFIAPLLNKSAEHYKKRLKINAEENKTNLQYWSVYHLENKDFVGTMNLNKFSQTGYMQVGLHLTRKYWNKGYGLELSKTLIKYAFEERKLDKIHWVYEVGHEVSRKLAEKLGFEPFEEMTEDGCNLWIYQLKKDA